MSTAASDAPRGRGLPLRRPHLIALAVLLLAYEFGVARQPALQPIAPQEALLAEAHGPAPQVVILGNSRMVWGVDQTQLARTLGLPASAVAKVAVDGGGLTNSLYFYQRHARRLAQARVVVIGFDAWELTTRRSPNLCDLRLASLRERLTIFDPRYLPVCLVSWAWRSTVTLRPVGGVSRRQHFAAIARHLLGRPQPEKRFPFDWSPRRDAREIERLWETGDWYRLTGGQNWHAPSGARDRATIGEGWLACRDTNDRHYRTALPGTGGRELLQTLAAALASRGPRVLLVRPPLPQAYTDDLQARYPRWAGAWQEALAALNQSARRTGGRVAVHSYGARIGNVVMGERAFYDYGHPSPLGRRVFTAELARLIGAPSEGAP